MDKIEMIKKLEIPQGRVDVILDTDTFNEIDDQFALAYLLASSDKLNTVAITAAPFLNSLSTSPADGMEKSYNEIFKVLRLADREDLNPNVYRGSSEYLPSENEPVKSEAAEAIVKFAMQHTPENPLYVVAIGAITNVASAILMEKEICNRMVVVWLGGHAIHWDDTSEFNMFQDIAAARIIFGSEVPFVQLPARGVVDVFATTKYELSHWLEGKNKLADYLAKNAIACADAYAKDKPWTRVIWDVTAVAWLLNDNDRFMSSKLINAPIPEYDRHYAFDSRRKLMRYVQAINRDALFEDLFNKLANYGK